LSVKGSCDVTPFSNALRRLASNWRNEVIGCRAGLLSFVGGNSQDQKASMWTNRQRGRPVLLGGSDGTLNKAAAGPHGRRVAAAQAGEGGDRRAAVHKRA
jgi:hypothetical protein